MKWIKIKIEYYSENMEITKSKLINIFEEIGIKQIEVLDYFLNNKLDYNIKFKNNFDIWNIIGYVVNNRFAMKKVKIILEKINEIALADNTFIYEIYTSECSDDQWKDQWKKYFHTTKISDSIVIKPSWESYEKNKNEIVIEIDPGTAFGTGTHETTSLCVNFLEKYSKNSKNLLDIGCGSGILMISGKKIGIDKVVGIDIDPLVENVVVENFGRNSIFDGYDVVIGNLVEKINEKYDLVVSNILVDVLENLLESIEKVLNPNAIVIFSGILLEKEEEFLKKAYNYNLKKVDRNIKNNWSSLVFIYEGGKI